MTANIYEFEEAVWAVDKIRVVVRAAWVEEIEEYSYDEPELENLTVAAFLRDRIRPYIGEREVVVINGYGECLYGGNKQLRGVRHSYRR